MYSVEIHLPIKLIGSILLLFDLYKYGYIFRIDWSHFESIASISCRFI